MTRQSISFTEPNNDWLQSQVDSKEYRNKSELINDLVRKERLKQEKIEFIRKKLTKAEEKGFVSETQDEILADIKKGLHLEKEV